MNLSRAACQTTLIAMLLGAGSPGFADSLTVRAPVVDVQPVTEPPREVQRCEPKPERSRGLGATLAWDLGLNCRAERLESGVVTGYRVFYRWDDRVFSRVMAQSPGETVPLSVRLD